MAGTALKEDEVRPVLATDGRNLAGEDADRSPVGAGMAQRDDVLPLREDHAGRAVGDGHRATS
jgi:hypothetical protein